MMKTRPGLLLIAVDRFTHTLGRTAGLLILLIMLTTTYEVTARYLFNAPTIWVWPLNRQLFGVFILFAGIYAMGRQSHIRIEILYDHFPPVLKKTADVIALAAFILFLGTVVWQGCKMGVNAWMVKEKASGAFRLPLYPLKMFIPAAGILFCLEGIYIFLVKPNNTDKE